MNVNNLVVYLPFDESTTQDLCGNTWTAVGDPTIQNGELVLNGTNYISADVAPIALFNSDFTIHFWMTYKDAKTSEGGFFTTSSNIGWQCYASKARFNGTAGKWLEIDSVNLSEFKNQHCHFAITRKDNTLYFFFNGTLKTTYTVGTFTGSGSTLFIGKRNNYLTAMNMDEFMIHSEALWTENFTPPTAADYEQFRREIGEPFSFEADMERVITNAAWKPSMNLKAWLPFNRTPTEDLCGNEWHGDNTVFKREITADGAINGNALQISYHGSTNDVLTYCLNMAGGITLGGQSFTIKGCFNLQS